MKPRTVRRLALASVVANSAIVVTGGAVRLTASGLGCPTWPRCTDDTLTPTAEYAVHGVIEFGNRLLTFVLTAVVLACLVAVFRQRPRRDGMRTLAVLVFLGIPAQALLGGVTVLTGLNPWSVMAHFLLSMLILSLAVVLHQRAREGDLPPRPLVAAPLRRLAVGLLVLVGATLAAGTVVTGSGPHSGDPAAGRTGLDPRAMSQLHADLVFLLVGVTAAFWLALIALERTMPGPATPEGPLSGQVMSGQATSGQVMSGQAMSGQARSDRVKVVRGPARAMGVLLAVELAQGLLGFTQYFTDLPVVLVGLHLAGACLVMVYAVQAVLSLRDRGEVSTSDPTGTTPAVSAAESVPVAV